MKDMAVIQQMIWRQRHLSRCAKMVACVHKICSLVLTMHSMLAAMPKQHRACLLLLCLLVTYYDRWQHFVSALLQEVS